MGIIGNMGSYGLAKDMFNYNKEINEYKKQQYESGEAWVNKAEGMEKAGISKNAQFGPAQTAGEMSSASGGSSAGSGGLSEVFNMLGQAQNYSMTEEQKKLLKAQASKISTEQQNIHADTMNKIKEKQGIVANTSARWHDIKLAQRRGLSVGEGIGGGNTADVFKTSTMVANEALKMAQKAVGKGTKQNVKLKQSKKFDPYRNTGVIDTGNMTKFLQAIVEGRVKIEK